MSPRRAIPAGLAALLLAPGARAQCEAGRYELLWHDEFSGSALDTSRWTVADYPAQYNNELQYYTPGAVTVAGGRLTLTSNNFPLHGRPYTSGKIESRGHGAFTYGRVEIRARLPGTQGIWPAFWLLPESGAWPPEIDVLELLGDDPRTVYMSNHWGTYPAVRSETSAFTGPDFTQGFHTFRADWAPGRIDYYVDGVKRATHDQGVPDVPCFVIVNTAVGGDWPGPPDPTTVFPQRFEADYVRVYRRIEPAQQLANAGFESGTASWTRWGNAYSEPVHARSGARSGKLFGQFSGSPNSSGFHQERPASAGQTFVGQAWWYNASNDAMRAGNTALTRIEFLSASNAILSSRSVTSLTADSARDRHLWSEVEATAPAGAVKARFVLIFVQPALDAGAAFFDDAVFGPVECPAHTPPDSVPAR